ncbi:ABC transporter ATP-binding protein [Xanthobacter sp. V4C-4]|uniref:ABC transporter ATP-binding protein n=1 Tax=Xanthobacter cornucopiae TaxID=3119924 RepID=UPI00372BAD30
MEPAPAPSASLGLPLRIGGLDKSYAARGGRRPVLRGIDLDVAAGAFVTLIGPSGCGKSTILRLVAGLDGDYDGSIRVGEAEVRGPDLSRGMLFQEHRLFPWLTVRQNVALGAFHAGLGREALAARIADLLERVGLGHAADLFPSQLSGGMAQRASIARTLAGQPRLLLLDEPFSALDAFNRISLQLELERLWQRSGITMVLVSHDIEEATYLSDRIVVLDADPGRIRTVVDNPLPRPRNRVSPAFNAIKERLFTELHVETAATRAPD